MKIQSYEVLTGSSRSHQKIEVERLGVSMETGGGKGQAGAVAAGRWDSVSFSSAAQQVVQWNEGGEVEEEAAQLPVAGTAKTGPGAINLTDKQRMKLETLRELLFYMTGRRFELAFFGMEDRAAAGGRTRVGPRSLTRVQAVRERASYERESVEYHARGVVITADGKTINIDMMMSMSQEFAEYSRTELGIQFPQGNASAIDPLVINYGGTAASLTGEKFAFDLDMDGTLDNISFAGPGSGFLALDKNGDGKIGDGSELFGPASGNGFAELRAHDADGNGWIDENDEVFGQLVVWSKDAEGKDQMFTLKELGIGAIYLGDTATEYAMKQGGETQGQMRSTSFFLRENGSAGYVHHIDLVV